MSNSVGRSWRIIAPAPDELVAATTPRRDAIARFDYVALADKARRFSDARAATRRQRQRWLAAKQMETPPGSAAFPPPGSPHSVRAGQAPAVDDQVATNTNDTMRRTLLAPAPGQPFEHAASAVDRPMARPAELLAGLAQELAAFCADPAIVRSGSWHASLELDARAFPSTTLQLNLSPSELSVRFDARDADIVQLLCHQRAALEHELAELMKAWSEPRVVCVTMG